MVVLHFGQFDFGRLVQLGQPLCKRLCVWCVCVVCVWCVVLMIHDTASLSWRVRTMHLIG